MRQWITTSTSSPTSGTSSPLIPPNQTSPQTYIILPSFSLITLPDPFLIVPSFPSHPLITTSFSPHSSPFFARPPLIMHLLSRLIIPSFSPHFPPFFPHSPLIMHLLSHHYSLIFPHSPFTSPSFSYQFLLIHLISLCLFSLPSVIFCERRFPYRFLIGDCRHFIESQPPHFVFVCPG